MDATEILLAWILHAKGFPNPASSGQEFCGCEEVPDRRFYEFNFLLSMKMEPRLTAWHWANPEYGSGKVINGNAQAPLTDNGR